MSVSLSFRWDRVVPKKEIVSLFLTLDEALEGFLGDFAVRAIPSYSITARNGTANRSLRSEVNNAVDALGGSPSSLHADYSEPYDAPRTGRSVRLSLLEIFGRVYVTLAVEGQNEEIAQGQFHTLTNQMGALIKREFPRPMLGIRLGILEHRVFSRILKHPIPSGLIVLILGTLILKAFGII